LKILITGSSGFIGRNLVNKLIQFPDIKVFGLDIVPSKIDNLNYEHIESDLNDENYLNQINNEIDIIIHLAQSGKYRENHDGVMDMFNINLKSTINLLEYARKKQVDKFIFASTGNVYKATDKILQETDDCSPYGIYACTKYASELFIKNYSEYFSTIILRLFTVYGLGQQKMLIPKMIERIKNNEQIILAGDIGIQITPLFIDDCVNMFFQIINSDNSRDYDVFNLAGNEAINLSQIVQYLGTMMNIIPNILIDNSIKPAYLKGDNSKFIKSFNFSPEVKIKDGLKKVLAIK